MMKICNINIPLGMSRSVEWNSRQQPHPVRDASLTCTKQGKFSTFLEHDIRTI